MKQILVHYGEDTIQAALCEDGKLVEIIADKKDGGSIVGNIYAGIVKNILPGQFAFVDIGVERNAFIHLADSKEAGLYEGGALTLKVGQTVLVQAMKDQAGEKGPAVTTELSFPGRHMVLFSSQSGAVGVSKKIENSGERARLKKMARELLASAGNAAEGVGLILRTGSVGVPLPALRAELQAELSELLTERGKTLNTGQYARAPAVVRKAGPALEKPVTELLSRDVGTIISDRADRLEALRDAAAKAGWKGAVEFHSGPVGLFVEHDVNGQLEKALAKKVWLKSGGFLVIEPTEACVAIDVNTGKCTGAGNRRSAAVRTNREAALEVARQIRLRNLSGMIIVDFIDVKEPAEKEALLALLGDAVKEDRLPVTVLGEAYLGVVMLTRKKVREPIACALILFPT